MSMASILRRIFPQSSATSSQEVTQDMILLVGLGNIGSQYINTPHNVGFEVVDRFATSWQSMDRCHALVSRQQINAQEVILAKPTTMMNLSGQAVSRLAQYFKIKPENIWIIYDELDLPLGRIKISTGTSNNGHNGVISIQEQLGHNRFWRFRVGIDTRQSREIPGRAYVLQQFTPEHQTLVHNSVQQATEALTLALQKDLQTAMQKFNKANALADDSE